ncbi:T-complex protein 1 subunit theta-like [Coffea eugenioides]|uniref:T-complex protein 1 subunit theta-like n=1 Tax=Coffea eugenioides TaxID=49369 RepID=UPI000F613427|nr:T-complex protein 1 subunit theta-like [Coffea eugenioides]
MVIINHLDKLFAATIGNKLGVLHLAAKILVLAGKAQQEEFGVGAKLCVSFAGELLQNAEDLIRMGLDPSTIYAINKTIQVLEELVEPGLDTTQVIFRMKAAVASKHFGQEDILCRIVAQAFIQVCSKNPANFNVDNVRVAKLLGGRLRDSIIIRGMVLKNDAVGSIKRMKKAKVSTPEHASGSLSIKTLQSFLQVAMFAGGVDTTATETKGTVLIHRAQQIGAAKVGELIKAIAGSGAKVIVSGAAIGEMALHFCERYKLMVLKICSKFELQRFCHTTGAVALLKLSPPNPDDLGYVDSISVDEIGGVKVTIVRNEEGGNSVSTVVLQGSTDSILDDLERAVDDGVNTYKLGSNTLCYFHLYQAMCRDSQIVPCAAATEIELARRLKEFSFKETG